MLGQGSYGLNANGSFGGDAVYAGLDGPSGYMSFTFDAPVAAFGAFLNYSPDTQSAQTISAYDANGLLLEAYDLTVAAPISTPGGFNAFDFRGISLADAVIKEFRLGGYYILASATADGTPVNPTPEPASLALVGAALAAAAWARRSRKA